MLSRLLQPALAAFPDRVAVDAAEGTQELTYRRLEAQASALAAHLLVEGNLQPQDRVALWMRNTPEVFVAYLACWKAGLIAVPLDPRYQPRQVRYILSDCGVRATIVDADRQDDLAATGFLEQLGCVVTTRGAPTLAGAVSLEAVVVAEKGAARMEPAIRYDAAAVIFYTSGTTSRPKGVVHSDRRVGRRVAKVLRECRLDADTVSLIALSLMRPLSFQLQALAVLAAGGCALTLPRFSAEAFWRVYRTGSAKTLLAFTPNMLEEVLRHPYSRVADYAALRVCLCGGDSVPGPLHALFAERTGGKELVEMCGMTETGPYAMNPPFGPKKAGCIGLAIEGTCVRIVDERDEDVRPGQRGEIVVRSPDSMVGYWNDTLRTMQVVRDGWVYTGDLGHTDSEGYLHFDGRLKEMIVRDGSNISPIEVEEAIEDHPAVQEAVVVGVDDGMHGQAIEAFLCWQPEVKGNDQTLLDEVRQRVAARLQALAVPRVIRVMRAWPRTGQGKIDRARLAWMAAAGGTLEEDSVVPSRRLAQEAVTA